MTKARDLANAGTALTTVSATELGYLDGVTSAVQTQINSKIGQSTAINPTIVDAKGDIIAATAADTVSRLAVGANNTVLTADSAEATGLKWATPAGGGKVLQVLQDTANTEIDNSTITYAATGLSQAITPASTSSKVLVTVSIPVHKTAEAADNAVTVRLLRGGTEIFMSTSQLLTQTAIRIIGNLSFSFLDSPSTTSSTTYSVEFKNYSNTNRARVCSDNSVATIILMEIGA